MLAKVNVLLHPLCKKCLNGKNVVPILYGMATVDMVKKAEIGTYKLGGFRSSETDKEWYCSKCEFEF